MVEIRYKYIKNGKIKNCYAKLDISEISEIETALQRTDREIRDIKIISMRKEYAKK